MCTPGAGVLFLVCSSLMKRCALSLEMDSSMRLAYMLAVFCMDSTVVVCAVSVMVCFLSLFIVDYTRRVGSVQVLLYARWFFTTILGCHRE